MKRKLLAFILAFTMVFSILPMQLFATAAGEGDEGENALVMKYDDRLEVSELGMTGEPVIETRVITSKKVCSDEADDAVVVYASGKLIAVGVGTAQVTWGSGSDAVSYEITVEPATISVFLVTGHSQAGGSGGDKTESVVCEEGQVYSTHEVTYNFLLCEGEPVSTVKAKDVTGMGIGYGSEKKPPKIDALTEAGDGTRALDGALAYRWHKLTGEKVWVLNASKGSTSLQTWQKGGYNYRHAVELFKAASEILNNEHQAGHYNVNHMGVVNYTAANGDQTWPAADYKTAFNSMWNGFREEFALYDLNGDGETDTVDCIGLAPPWMYLRTYNVWDDLIPEPLAFYTHSDETNMGKILNYYMSAFEDDGVILASTAGRRWTTDADVKAYFEENPVENMYGVLQNGKTHTSPTEVKFGVNADGGHYMQLGYNVQGIEIANNMYAYWNGNNALQSVRLLQENGVDEVPESIEVPLNRSYVIVPETVPSTAKLTYKVTGDAAYYENGFIYGDHEGEAVLTVMDTEGNTLKTVNVTITEPVAKEDYKWYAWDFTTPSLTNTAGSMTNNELSLHASAVPDANLQSWLTGGVLDLTSGQSTLKMSKSILLETPKAWSVELVAAAKSSADAIGTFLSTKPSMSEAKYMYVDNKGDLMLVIKAAFTADDGTLLENKYTYFKVSDEDFAKSKLDSDFNVADEHKYELRCASGVISYWLDGEKVGDLTLSEQSISRGDDAKHYISKQPDYNGENFNSMTMEYWGTGNNKTNYSQSMTAKVKKLAIYAGSEMLNLKVVLSAIPSIAPIAIHPGEQITLPAPDTSEYCAKFVCWSETPDGDGATYNAGDVYTVSTEGSVTLYAIWDDSAGAGADHVYDNEEDTICGFCGYERTLSLYDASGKTKDCTWYLKGTKLTVTGNGEMERYESADAVPWGNAITEVVIEEGVTYVGSYSFYGCTSLTTVTLPSTLTTIAARAFNGCTALRSLEIPASVEIIAGRAFNGCSALTDLTLPGTLTTLGERAFYGCTSLTDLTLPGTLTILGERAFYGCTSLTSITIPGSVTTVKDHTFNGCSSLATVTISKGVTSIGAAAFANCTSLTSITIPASVTSIGGSAFTKCTVLTDVWYEGSVSDRENLEIGTTNELLIAATWHYVDNACDATCNECGAERTVLPHDFSAEKQSDTEHWTECSACGTVDESTRGTHIYDNACDATCNECGAERTPADHVYDNDKDADCNECGAERIVYTIGDVNDDGAVDSNDAIYLLYYTLLGEARFPINQPVDYNKDGTVNSADAIYLLYHTLLGAERYPIDPLAGQKALFVGDSVCYGYSDSQNRSWAERIADKTGLTSDKRAVSGTSVSNVRKAKQGIIVDQIPETGNYDFIMLEGGGNDAWSKAAVGTMTDSFDPADFNTDTFAGGLENLIYTAMKRYGDTAKIGYLILYQCPAANKGYLSDMTDYVKMTKQICEKWGVSYFDMYNHKEINEKLEFTNTKNTPDYIHPNDAGYEILTPYILEYMRTIPACDPEILAKIA